MRFQFIPAIVCLVLHFRLGCPEHVITLLGESDPETVQVLRSTYKPLPQIRKLEEIGSTFRHIFTIKNDGTLSSPGGRLSIQWPCSIKNPHDVEEELTYLETTLTIEAFPEDLTNRIKCRMPQGLINPLNLTVEQERLATDKFQKTNKTVSKSMLQSPWHFNLDCNHPRVNCAQLECDIPALDAPAKLTIAIPARLWESTLIQDLSAFHTIHIHSRASLYFAPLSRQTSPEVLVTTAELTAVIEPARADDPGRNWEGPFFGITIGVAILLTVFYVTNYRKSAKFQMDRLTAVTTKSGKGHAVGSERPRKPKHVRVKFSKIDSESRDNVITIA